MVKGIERFREYFRDYTDQYVLIGGAACDISFESNNPPSNQGGKVNYVVNRRSDYFIQLYQHDAA